MGVESIDREGRIITLEYNDYYLVNVYTPNSGEGLKRLDYRVNTWDIEFFKYVNRLKKRKNIIIAGDINCAHLDIDVYDPIGKQKQAGFTVEERNNLQKLLNSGFIDTYRHFYPDRKQYTFWAARNFARWTNSGWRIDSFLVNNNKDFINRIIDSQILDEYEGSDHCPIKLILK